MTLNPHIKIQSESHKKQLEFLSENMLPFGKVCLPTMFSVKSPPFHTELATVLNDPVYDKVNIVAPRGHAKSSIAACLKPLHHLFFEDRPKLILLVSKTEGHAIRLLQTIKNALDYSIPLRQMVGYWGEHSARKWRDSEVVLKDNTLIICRGTGQHIVGMKHGDQRPTLIIVDDPEDMNNTKTAEAMEYNLKWLLQVVAPGRDPLRSKIVVIGTPQHERCMVETLKRTAGWKSLHYDAIIDEKKHVVLWPEWWSYERLMQEKAMYESINRLSSFYREYRCQIIGDEDQLFKESYIRYWDGELEFTPDHKAYLKLSKLNGVTLSPPEIRPVNIFTGVDPASSTAQTADYSTIVHVAVDNQMNRFILPYFRKHIPPLRLADAIIEQFLMYHSAKSRIESVGYQDMLRQYLRETCDKKGIYIPGLEIKENPRSQKSYRLETLQPFFALGKIYLKEGMQELVDELLLYPRGTHDDLLDGLYYACKGNYRPSHERATRTTYYIEDEEAENELNWALS